MLKKLHHHFEAGELSLKDYLAAHRTILANDRTWLAYMRTALTLFVAGASFIQFFDSGFLVIVGWLFLPLGVFVLAIGFYRHSQYRKLVRSIKKSKHIIKRI
jgi:putative membrane protein